ncbi:hypothetical protein NDU88_003290 [Pleurodeles waltl]|uniref:Uncharacterized protein n=1 Tax=Pleurodeles waltl TaxID=8319 RepID=A0AAV7MQ55_PLEWA|nr:hypothetical protein NDU88_003290 [Pleurodeles waltl]
MASLGRWDWLSSALGGYKSDGWREAHGAKGEKWRMTIGLQGTAIRGYTGQDGRGVVGGVKPGQEPHLCFGGSNATMEWDEDEGDLGDRGVLAGMLDGM